MVLEEVCRDEVGTAGVSGASDEAHFGGHGAISRLALHCAAGVIGVPVPFLHSAGRDVDMAAKRPLIGLLFFLEAVDVVRKELLRHVYVDFALRLLHDFLPASASSVGRGRSVIGIKSSFFFKDLRIAGEIRAYEVAVFRAPKGSILQAKLEVCDFSGLAIAY